VAAVVHAHPPYATAFAVAGIAPDPRILAEVVVTLGAIPVAEFQLPSTRELAAVVQHYILYHDAVLLANHGAITVGANLQTALFRMQTLEHFSKIYWIARQLGTPQALSPASVRALEDLRTYYGVKTAAGPAARTSGNEDERRLRQVVEAVADRVFARLAAPRQTAESSR
jgi:L-fuculose-phosphate aldolase